MIQKHVMNIHQGENTSFADVETKFLSTKILHGICKNENLYDNKKKIPYSSTQTTRQVSK